MFNKNSCRSLFLRHIETKPVGCRCFYGVQWFFNQRLPESQDLIFIFPHQLWSLYDSDLTEDELESSLHFSAPLDDSTRVDLRWVRTLVLHTLERLHDSSKWESLAHFALLFNSYTRWIRPVLYRNVQIDKRSCVAVLSGFLSPPWYSKHTHRHTLLLLWPKLSADDTVSLLNVCPRERYALTIVPLLVHAQRRLLERVGSLGGPAVPQPHHVKTQRVTGQQVAHRNGIMYHVIPRWRQKSKCIYRNHTAR